MSITTCISQAQVDAVPGPKQVIWISPSLWVVRSGADVINNQLPAVLSSRQFWLSVDDAGLTVSVKAVIAASPTRIQIEVSEATEIRRDHPLIDSMAQALGKSLEDIDALFAHGATL